MNKIFGAMAMAGMTSFGALVAPLAASAQEAEAPVAEAPAAETAPIEISGMMIGDPDAPVTLTEFFSYTCPHCASFHANQFQQLKADYIDTGKINFVYQELFLRHADVRAALTARCDAGQRYEGILDILMERQNEWYVPSNDLRPTVENLYRIGVSAGMEPEVLQACLNDGEMAQALAEWSMSEAETYGVNATPTLMIDGTTYSNMPYDELSALLDAELAKVAE